MDSQPATKADLKAELAAFETHLVRWIVGTTVAAVAATVAIVIGV